MNGFFSKRGKGNDIPPDSIDNQSHVSGKNKTQKTGLGETLDSTVKDAKTLVDRIKLLETQNCTLQAQNGNLIAQVNRLENNNLKLEKKIEIIPVFTGFLLSYTRSVSGAPLPGPVKFHFGYGRLKDLMIGETCIFWILDYRMRVSDIPCRLTDRRYQNLYRRISGNRHILDIAGSCHWMAWEDEDDIGKDMSFFRYWDIWKDGISDTRKLMQRAYPGFMTAEPPKLGVSRTDFLKYLEVIFRENPERYILDYEVCVARQNHYGHTICVVATLADCRRFIREEKKKKARKRAKSPAKETEC